MGMTSRLRTAWLAAPLVVGLMGAGAVASVKPASVTSKSAHWGWKLTVPAPPPARTDASMVYDEATHQVVLFGGSAFGAFADTWIWDGERWSDKTGDNGPPARSHAAMVYDAASRQVLLFGGYGTAGALGDTWVWNGKRWSEVQTSNGPSPRQDAGIVYDPANRKVVMFGGSGPSGTLSDTWVWSGNSQGQAGWTQLATLPSADDGPAARSRPGLVYDAARKQVVLFGGTGGGAAVQDTTTWVLSPTASTWTAAASAGPSARQRFGMVYDGAHRQVVLVSGTPTSIEDETTGGETWTWNGATWTKAAAVLPARYEPGLIADPACRCVLLLGGREGHGVPKDDTWRWDGTTWHGVVPNPAAHWAGMAMAYDAHTKEVITFGGFGDINGIYELGETWLWAGQGWRPATKNGPPRSPGWHTVYDSARRELVAFQQSADGFSETWLWNGHGWRLAANVSPPNQYPTDPLYTYDAGTKQIVAIFREDPAYGSGIATPAATMAWNGRRWRSVTSKQPPAMTNAAMVYDAASRQVILFGGSNCPTTGVLGSGVGPDIQNNSTYCAETWIWNGSHWSKYSGSGPSPRANAVMAYDAARRQVVLHGGVGAQHVVGNFPQLTQNLNDTWLWNGKRWSKVTPTHVPPTRGSGLGSSWAGPTMGYDPSTRRVVLFGTLVDQGAFGTGVKAAPAVDEQTYSETPSGTWLWDGKDWTDATTSKGPIGEYTTSLTYHGAYGHLLVLGAKQCPTKSGTYGYGAGPDYNGPTGSCGVWSWTGKAWRQHPSPAATGVTTPEDALDFPYVAATGQVAALTSDGLWTWGRH